MFRPDAPATVQMPCDARAPASDQREDHLGWSAFLAELEAVAAAERANDPEGMAALEAQWAAELEAVRRENAWREEEEAMQARELRRARTARLRARKRAMKSAVQTRHQMLSFFQSWRQLAYEKQLESVDAFHVVLESMMDEILVLEKASSTMKRRSAHRSAMCRRNASAEIAG